jgi:hypothetical protein
MKYKVILICLLFFCLVFGCGTDKLYTHKAEVLVSSVMVLEVMAPWGWESIGSAVATYDDNGDLKIVTAGHIAFYTLDLHKRICHSIHIYECVMIREASLIMPSNFMWKNDWAYYDAPLLPRGIKPASKSKKQSRIGEEIWAVGTADGRPGEVTSGHITNIHNCTYIIDARVLPGNSGGAVFNKKGQLIGIISALLAPEELGPDSNNGVVVPITEINFD